MEAVQGGGCHGLLSGLSSSWGAVLCSAVPWERPREKTGNHLFWLFSIGLVAFCHCSCLSNIAVTWSLSPKFFLVCVLCCHSPARMGQGCCPLTLSVLGAGTWMIPATYTSLHLQLPSRGGCSEFTKLKDAFKQINNVTLLDFLSFLKLFN